MSADQIAVIRPMLADLYDALERREPDAERLCVTFTLSGHDDIWAQVMAGTINVAYPRDEPPSSLLASAGVATIPGLTLVAHEPGSFATWAHGPCSLRALAAFVGDVLTVVHELDDDCDELDVVFEHVIR